MSTETQNMAAAMTAASMAHEYVHEGRTVRLTGRYAVGVANLATNARHTELSLRNSIQVEIRDTDPDLKNTYWVKYSDLAQVGDARRGE